MSAAALFVGHGSPMNAISKNEFTASLKLVGERVKKPQAIVMISAHWMTPYTAVSLHNSSALMYDMHGFPEALYKVEYPAVNAEFLVPKMRELIEPLRVQERALDHGVWSVLLHIFPKADIPIMQLSINSLLSLEEHYSLGEKLASLREMDVMIIGSGNITHNLSQISAARDEPAIEWAKEFDSFVKTAIEKRDFHSLVDFEKRNKYAKVAHPTLEHYIPLLYIAGASSLEDESSFIYEGMEHGSLSLRSWLLQK